MVSGENLIFVYACAGALLASAVLIHIVRANKQQVQAIPQQHWQAQSDHVIAGNVSDESSLSTQLNPSNRYNEE